ncbi:MAG TPA: hypothetical protein VK983_05330 [Candidatus Limnocylindrales bacterium]|nr:hypothetical protein [Candidatus Limnocylindrales bacterium]
MKLHRQPALNGIIEVLGCPIYAATAIVAAVISLGLLVWLFTFDTLLYVLTLPDYPMGDKLNFLISPYANSISYFFSDPVVAARLVFSILAGINIALYLFIRKHEASVTGRKGLSGFLIALIGSGCVACGTSILSPLLVGVGAGASAVIGAAVSTFGYVIGILLMLYSINGLSKRAEFELARIR